MNAHPSLPHPAKLAETPISRKKRAEDGAAARLVGGEQATTKAKYRDLSTAAAKCAAFGRDDVAFMGVEENKQQQRQICRRR
jgi:hypothetical protein